MINISTSVESAIIGRSTTQFKESLSRFAYAMPLVINKGLFQKKNNIDQLLF